MKISDLKLMFNFFTLNEDRLDALLDLGKDLKKPTEEFSEKACVKGCASFIALRIKNKKLESTSDSIIMKGFLKILEIFYNEKPNENPFDFLKELKIDSILSTQRQNGLLSILKKIKDEHA